MQKLKGIPTSPGIASGPAHIFRETELKIEKRQLPTVLATYPIRQMSAFLLILLGPRKRIQ
jgi:phosphoenolpyruvate-protein kinase (PTS system EI component)